MKCPYINPTIAQCENCSLPDCYRDEKEDVNQRAREWRKNNPDKVKAIRQRMYLKNAEREREYQRKKYQIIKDNPEYKSCKKEYSKKYRQRNIDRLRQKDRDYYRANRERKIKYAAEYRARKKAERVS